MNSSMVLPMSEGKAQSPTLDENCQKIILTLITIGEKIRFNKLHDLLGQQGVELPKSSLTIHLGHLADKDLVIRKLEGVQNVSYEVNHEKFSNQSMKRINDELRRIEELRSSTDEKKRAFYSEPIDKQVKIVLDDIILRTLQQLKMRIDLKSNRAKYEKFLELMILSRFSMIYAGWLTEKCVEDKEYREKVFQKIDELIKKAGDQCQDTS